VPLLFPLKEFPLLCLLQAEKQKLYLLQKQKTSGLREVVLLVFKRGKSVTREERC
jgi:hypothetical protein